MTAELEKVKSILSLGKPSFDEMNLNKLSFARELTFALQKFEENPFLQTTQGIEKVLTNLVLSGLSLNPVLKYSYLVPRKVKGKFVCCVDPSYMGLCKILTDTGSVVGISATIVYEKEVHTLDIQQGMGGHATHKPYMGFEKPGKAIACYSVAVLPNGMKHVELLRPWEWEAIKSRSESVKSYKTKQAAGEYAAIPTWETDEEEMIRKTCLKKHYKYLPKTERSLIAAQAIDLDNQLNGINFEEEKRQAAAEGNHDPKGTPETPFADALATDEDMQRMVELVNDKAMPDKIFPNDAKPEGVSKFAVQKGLAKRFQEGTLIKADIEKYIKGLEDELSASLDRIAAEMENQSQEPAQTEA